MKVERICAFVGVAASFTSAFANPPFPPPGRESETIVPHGGFVRTLKKLQLERRATVPLMGAPPAGGLKGTRRLPLICIEFSEGGHPFEVSAYQQLLFGNPPHRKTMTQYYRDISNGALNVTGRVLGWYKMPKKDTYYENQQNGWGTPFGELLQAALERADSDIDFAEFDNDGPDGVANSGDDDGKVDTVVLIQPEIGGEYGNANIWSHSSHYSNPGLGHSKPFETKDVRKDKSGKAVLGANGEQQHILIEDYVIQPGITNAEEGAPKRLIKIGVFCHEFGHALGLPDLYDRTPPPQNQPADSSGIGDWCLMSGGSYGGDGEHSVTPVEMNAWCKQLLGWANIVNLQGGGAIDLECIAERNQAYRIDVPSTDEKEYFLIEYRDPGWRDINGTRINWDENLPVAGLAIWHIDERVGATLPNGQSNPNWPFADQDQGQNDSPSLAKSTSSGSIWRNKHSLVALIQADGLNLLEKQRDQIGDASDLFRTGMKWEDDQQLRRGSRSYDAKATGFEVADINLQNATATVVFPGLSPPHASGQPADSAPLGKAAPDSSTRTEKSSVAKLPSDANGTSSGMSIGRATAPPVGSGARAKGSFPVPSLRPEKAESLTQFNSRLNTADVAGVSATKISIDGAESETTARSSATVGDRSSILSKLNERLAAAGKDA